MRMKIQLSRFLAPISFCLLIATLSTGALAQIEAEPLPGDPKLVEFSYDVNNSYRVFTKPMASTHIQLEKDERVTVLAMGDTASWITANRDNNVFIKPKYPNISTSATLITTKRDYQFVFRSTSENGRWYQRVSFQDPSRMLIENQDLERAQVNVTQDLTANAGASSQRGTALVKPEQLNFNYEITGDSNLRPSSVYDDGSFTYIQLRSDQDVPAVFRLIGKDVELVEFNLRGTALVIPRILEAGLLKLGNSEAKFYNKTKETPNAAVNFFKGLFR